MGSPDVPILPVCHSEPQAKNLRTDFVQTMNDAAKILRSAQDDTFIASAYGMSKTKKRPAENSAGRFC